MADKRQHLRRNVNVNLAGVSVAVGELGFAIHQLDRHGWTNITNEELQELHEAHAELKAFIKQWSQKYKKITKDWR
jgi:hypothetical protein